MSPPVTRHGLWLSALLLAVLGAVAVAQATSWGAGLRNDSYLYLVGADNLAAGKGYSRNAGEGELRPINHNPPLYSAWLASWEGLGVPATTTARVSSIGFFALTILLVQALVWRVSHSGPASLGAGLIVAAAPGMIDTYSGVMTEPLYLPLALGGIFLVSLELQEHSWPRLVSSAVLVSAAYMTRYIGLTVATTAALGFLAVSWPSRDKVRRLATFLAISVGPSALWLARNLVLTGSATNRMLEWHPIPLATLEIGAKTVLGWLLPMTTLGAKTKALILLPLLALAVFTLLRRQRRPIGEDLRGALASFPGLLVVHALVYSTALIATILWVDNSIVLDDRNLAPVFLCVVIVALAGLARAARSVGLAGRIGLSAVVVAIGFLSVQQTLRVVDNARVNGIGYLDVNWRTSGTIQHVRELPDVPIYSNAPVPIYFLAGRVARLAPFRIDPATGQPRADYQAWLQRMRMTIETEGGFLVLFNVARISQDPVDRAWLDDLRQGLDLMDEHSDGAVYAHRPEGDE